MQPAPLRDIQALRDRIGVFADRADAGRILAGLVAGGRPTRPLVLAIPAGGVPVAFPLASELGCPLDVAVVSKITLPWNSEAGYGAVAFDGSCRLNLPLISAVGLSEEQVAAGIEQTRVKVARRVAAFRGEKPFPALAGRDIVLVDDGLASGFTMLVALDALRGAGARRIIVAVPTGHLQALQQLAGECREVCCANVRRGAAFAVASAYRHWEDVREEEALRLLAAQA